MHKQVNWYKGKLITILLYRLVWHNVVARKKLRSNRCGVRPLLMVPVLCNIELPLPWMHLILKTMKRFLWCVLRIVRCRALQKTLRYPSLRDIDLLICFWISTFLHSQRINVECKSKYYQIWITIFQIDIKCKLSGLLDWIQYTYMFEI